MLRKPVTVWCEPRHVLYSARPIIEKYVAQRRAVFAVVRQQDEFIAKSYFGNSVKVVTIESLDSGGLQVLHKITAPLLVASQFSTMYSRSLNRRGGWAKVAGKYIAPLTTRLNFNHLYSYFFSFFPNRLPSQFLISFTRSTRPYLLAPCHKRHIMIMESWDHPIKAPLYIEPKMCMTWNRSLKQDLKQYQKLKNVRYIKPLKLRYVEAYRRSSTTEMLERLPSNYKYELQHLLSTSYFVYPATTSSANPIDHKGEIRLIKDLISVFSNSEHVLYIKPKPNGPVGDYDEFALNANVKIGAYSSDPQGDDMLDEDYHVFRYLLLRHATAVINVATTFVLEAALASTPILQLVLSDTKYGHFALVSKNPHVERYLTVFNGVVPVTRDLDDVGQAITNVRMFDCSDALKRWLQDR